MAATLDILGAVRTVIDTELHARRADGQTLQVACAAVARLLGITPRRVRAYHHGEVAEDDVRARELLAAQAAADARVQEQLAAARALIARIEGENPHADTRAPMARMAGLALEAGQRCVGASGPLGAAPAR